MGQGIEIKPTVKGIDLERRSQVEFWGIRA